MHLINEETLFIGFGSVKQPDINIFMQSNEMFTFSLRTETLTMIEYSDIKEDDSMTSYLFNCNHVSNNYEHKNTLLI